MGSLKAISTTTNTTRMIGTTSVNPAVAVARDCLELKKKELKVREGHVYYSSPMNILFKIYTF